MDFFHKINKCIPLFLVIFSNCIEPYQPPTSSNNPNYLVIDATANSNEGSASVNLLRTTTLTSLENPARETGAFVSIQNDKGESWKLNASENGLYSTTGINFTSENKYRLYIKTINNKEYQSDFTSVKITPEIDSVNWVIEGDELKINVNTHDLSGKSRYYKWNCVETYEYVSKYASSYIIENGMVYSRPTEKFIDKCWKTNLLNQILIGNTNRLSEDRVNNFNLKVILSNDIRISKKYSLLVHQISITEQAYTYWLNVKKTTESLGGLFDPLPAQVIGNIYSISDPNEPVIGYFSAGSLATKRIFIDASKLPRGFFNYIGSFCPIDTLELELIPKITNPDVLIAPVYFPGGPPVLRGYSTSSPHCIDCRILGGGVVTKPDFWQ